MSYDVRKTWSQKDVSVDALNGWGATAYYSVTATTVAELDDERGVLEANGTGGQIPPIGASHPAQRNLRVVNKSAGPGLTERMVTVRYQWITGDFNLSFTGNDDPLKKKPSIKWGRVVNQEYMARNIHGVAITNSAGDAIDPPPTRPVVSRMLTILRYERGYKPEIADRFEDTVNDKLMIAGGRKFPRGTVRCDTITPAEEYTDGNAVLLIQYDLEIRTKFFRPPGKKPSPMDLEPFRFWHADVGLRSYFEGGANSPGDLYHFDAANSVRGEMVTSPVRLHKGAPIEINQYVVGLTSKAPRPAVLFPYELGPMREGINGTDYLGWEVCRYDNLLELGL